MAQYVNVNFKVGRSRSCTCVHVTLAICLRRPTYLIKHIDWQLWHIREAAARCRGLDSQVFL